ncbi:3-hydroxyacyl-CoA dehydrogenase NAD-binding domain-containing protein [Mesorhizobium sp. VK25A]|uniref:3-hydroxyacyl-CoA dehydrogenase NAD-binding domain-containing protein n=1 Tax=Mesorhizobium vachelliae TaxID=3072309 RepID=A0ABU5AAQ2_9HYPH|nr:MULTISPECIES: 3-hydroxyacyl-CoA dehydrogenase NAD-binding domain-containing protein [unclassified Mesorhizobium]MDX8533291.1 3-hydroxyacyl-CoA dehydrogenase NAD-binding domain-containing protein [Mesorhizobium sp. VK25D]MDX8545210.1 3-hydroxyacyl-CoA dehydrogenase NAD-binding domain-containing protein [Mesorhizobium sp. VK25A]
MDRLTIGVVGFGVIGQRWAACFAHAGHDVRIYDPAEGQEAVLHEVLPALAVDLDGLKGPAPAPGEIRLFATMAETLERVDFVQENGPEDLSLKRRLLAEIESHIGDEVIVASSSSALLVSDIQAECRVPGRIVLGHPFNPAHLMPLVEIVGGKATDPQAIARARAVYEDVGKKPVTLNREVTGHLALRLMGAMWREAIALVRDGVASVEDIDRAFMYGPGPKWTLQGSFISNSLNADGIEDFLRKYGPTYQAIWDTLLEARLDADTIRAVSASTGAAMRGRGPEELRAAREAGLVGILRTVAEHGAL